MSESKLTERVQVLLTPEEKAILSKQAEAEGRSMSNAARRLILAALAAQQLQTTREAHQDTQGSHHRRPTGNGNLPLVSPEASKRLGA